MSTTLRHTSSVACARPHEGEPQTSPSTQRQENMNLLAVSWNEMKGFVGMLGCPMGQALVLNSSFQKQDLHLVYKKNW